MHAGPEIGVAATKSFTSQVVILTLVGLLLGRMRHLSTAEGTCIIDALEALPEKSSNCSRRVTRQKRSPRNMSRQRYLFFGRQLNFPIALEAALKVKEITYLYAEGHPSAELKHGVIALVKPELPSVFITPDDAVFSKNLNNIEQVRARKGPIIAVTTASGATKLKGIADDLIIVPEADDVVMPVLTVIPMQLFAYHLAVALGRDVDKPRNLAKSVTVE
jgi:glucosamine--fructose-6-phosphate aminotransferase (isomerizing)